MIASTRSLIKSTPAFPSGFNISATMPDLINDGVSPSVIPQCIFMPYAVAFLENGFVRVKSLDNILLRTPFFIFLGCIAFWICGYAFAFGEGNGFIGLSSFFCSTHFELSQESFWFYHSMLAATAATIVGGAVAERCDIRGYMVYTIVLTGFVYPVVAHWSWSSEGWLQIGVWNATDINGTVPISFQDFAGSGVVHLTGGVSAFVGARMVGPREGRFDESPINIIPQPFSYVMWAIAGYAWLLGGFWSVDYGWKGDGDGSAYVDAVLNTIVACNVGGLVAIIIHSVVTYIEKRSLRPLFTGPSLLIMINGSLAAMVSIYAGNNLMQPWAAALTGTVAAGVYYAVSCLISYNGIDDPVDAVAVHAGGGFWGLIATSFFNGKMVSSILLWNLVGGIAITWWSATNSLIMFWLLEKVGWLRIATDVQNSKLK